jgi:uncharacterized protein YjbI with pentapeptide repeats
MHSDLAYANLHGAILSKADLSGAELELADLSAADLSGANLSDAHLNFKIKVIFTYAVVPGNVSPMRVTCAAVSLLAVAISLTTGGSRRRLDLPEKPAPRRCRDTWVFR